MRPSVPALSEAIRRRIGTGLLGAISMVAAGAAATRVAATAKDLVVSHRFGTSDALDAFLIAFALPVFFAGSFRNAFYSAFVPRFIEAEGRSGRPGASALLVRSLGMHLAILVGLALFLATLSSPLVSLVAHGFGPEKRALARELLVALTPFVVLDGASGIYTATLNARGRYVAGALLAMIPPLVTLVAVAAFSGRFGVHSLVFGAIAGAAIELIVAIALVRGQGFHVSPSIGPPGPEATAVLRAFTILSGSVVVISANTVVDQAMAANAAPGSVAALGYAAKVPAAVVGLAGLALGTTALPHYARMAAARRWDEMASSLRRHALRLGLAGVTIAVGLAAVSLPLTRLLFERGSFGPSDTARVAGIQALYALQVPGFLIGIVGAHCLIALGRHRMIFAVCLWNFMLNAVGDWVFLRWIGLPGIALATSVFYSVGAIVLLFACRRAIRQQRSRQTP